MVGGTLVDGFGSTPLRNSVILIEGERITAVGQVGSLAVPAGAEVISTEGMTVLPGLWDMHVHTMLNGHPDYDHWDKTYVNRLDGEIMRASARQLLMAGVTTARDLGAPLEASIAASLEADGFGPGEREREFGGAERDVVNRVVPQALQIVGRPVPAADILAGIGRHLHQPVGVGG